MSITDLSGAPSDPSNPSSGFIATFSQPVRVTSLAVQGLTSSFRVEYRTAPTDSLQYVGGDESPTVRLLNLFPTKIHTQQN